MDEFVAKVSEKVRAAGASARRRGRGSVEVGAITFPPQLQTIEEPCRPTPCQKGARACSPAAIPRAGRGGGRFYEAHRPRGTWTHTMKIMTEETFGPTLPIMKVRDSEEAISSRQTTPLTGSAPRCSLATPTAGEQVARRLENGRRQRPTTR